MNIIYVSNSCSKEKFNSLQECGMVRNLPPVQKYHKLLMEGLAKTIDGKVYSISAIPVNRSTTKKLFFSRETEKVNGIEYIYEAFINFPVIRQLTRYYRTKKVLKDICKKNKDCVIICDVLVQSIADACRKVGNKKGIPVMGIVTDVPSFLSGAENQGVSFCKKMFFSYAHSRAQKNSCKYDSYLFLTKEMNNIINERKVPFIVMEGHCDTNMEAVAVGAENKSHPKVMLYSGGIHREYGVKTLVEAFLKSSLPDWELHIYGYGNYSDDLIAISKANTKVKFFGVKPNDYIVQKQTEAFLVINPRPTKEEFVKYSFPSKNLEYMASGTAMLTTLLPGMPKEYLDYVYTITDESVDGMEAALKKVASLSEEELLGKGAQAKEFVLREKNNVKQAEKLVKFIEEEFLKK